MRPDNTVKMKKKQIRPILLLLALVLALTLVLSACGGSQQNPPAGSGSAVPAQSGNTEPATDGSTDADGVEKAATLLPAPEIAGLTLESTMQTQYASQFDVFYYSDGYKVLSISDGRQYLLVPEGKEVPEGADENLFIIQAPLDHVYLAATSAMALLLAVDAQDAVTMTGTNASGWFIPEAAELVESGKIKYAGKYSEPDYEMLVGEDCDLAIESTMILHSPKVQEMIEKMGIPVFIDRASYETHPLGRTEWIRLYGAMFDKEEAAQEVFAQKAQIVEDMKNFTNTEKTVAYFNIKTDGTAQIRNPKDYIATMIEIGGARYAFRDMKTDVTSASTLNISMEEFYATARDADYLIYNATIAAPIETVEDLYALSDLFKDFKAVKEGNVWCGGNNMYQATDIVADFILDVNNMVTGGSEEDMTFLKKVN